jgi:ketosteroid isomerase-like protein
VSTDVVRQLFERVNADGVEAAIDLFSADFVAVVPPSMSAEPDTYEGHDGVRRYFAGFEGLLEDVRFEPVALEEHDGAVIALLRFSGRGATSGLEVEQAAAVINWIEGGKITRMEAHPDLDEARAVLASRR